MREFLNLLALIILFPLALSILLFPPFLITAALVLIFEITEDGGIALSILIGLSSYFAFITKTEVGGKISEIQLRLMNLLPGYIDDSQSFSSKVSLIKFFNNDQTEKTYEKVYKFAKNSSVIYIEDIMEITGYNYANSGIIADRLISDGVVTNIQEKDESYKTLTENAISEMLDDARQRIRRHGRYSPSILQREMMMPYTAAVEIIRRLKQENKDCDDILNP